MQNTEMHEKLLCIILCDFCLSYYYFVINPVFWQFQEFIQTLNGMTGLFAVAIIKFFLMKKLPSISIGKLL